MSKSLLCKVDNFSLNSLILFSIGKEQSVEAQSVICVILSASERDDLGEKVSGLNPLEEDEADEKGLTLVGYYHSHPNSPAIPSEYDRDHALPNFVYIITSVQAGKAVYMRGWKLKAHSTQPTR